MSVHTALGDMIYANPGLLEVLASIDGWLPGDDEIPEEMTPTGRRRQLDQWTLNAMRDWLDAIAPYMEPDEEEEPPGYWGYCGWSLITAEGTVIPEGAE